jgi:hypothetical protein
MFIAFAFGDLIFILSFFYDDCVRIDPLGFKKSPPDVIEFLKFIGDGYYAYGILLRVVI